MPVDGQSPGVVDLADDDGLDLPLLAQGEEGVEVVRRHDGAHALLRLAHEDLLRRERGIAQQDAVEPDVHAALAVGRQLAGGAGDAGAAEVLDALHESGVQHLEGGLDQELLHERIADLNAGSLRRAAFGERLRREDRDSADPVAAGAGAVQDDEVAHALGAGEVDVLVPHRPHAQCVDQRVAEVRRVEHDLATDVGQAQAVPVAADSGHDAGHHAPGVGGVQRSEPKRIHHGQRARAHGQDVADDAADSGGGTLVRLHVGRVVVALDLERHGPAVADVDDASVLADADEQHIGVRLLLPELAQVHLARLVGAVLAPHHGVHRELGTGRATSEDVHDPLVLVGLEPQFGVGLRVVGIRAGVGDGVDHEVATREFSSEVKKGRPSMPGPVSSSTACSGCGISPTTFPRSFRMPAMSRRLPFGLTSR